MPVKHRAIGGDRRASGGELPVKHRAIGGDRRAIGGECAVKPSANGGDRKSKPVGNAKIKKFPRSREPVKKDTPQVPARLAVRAGVLKALY